MTSTDLPVLDNPALDAPLRSLLAAVPGPDPCGVSLRADPLFTDIRLAREEDDPTLPMRQWERPLKKADWAQIESLCTDALTGRSKDLQLAAWLAEAWTRQDAIAGEGLAGLARGLLLLRELVIQHWDSLYPRLDPPEEGGGCEARVAPFEWFSENMARAVRVHVCLFPLAQRKPARVTLAEWERLTASELAAPQGEAPQADPQSDEPPLTREEIIANVACQAPSVVERRLHELREAMSHLDDLDAELDARLGADAPPLGRLGTVFEEMERVLLQVRAALPVSKVPVALPVQAGPVAPAPAVPGEGDTQHDRSVPGTDMPPSQVATTAWRNRDEAYRTLEALAAYLMAIEPHSPTPYLIRRAVNWGRLPLPELMAEIMQEEGDLNRMVQLLGLNR